MIINRLAKRSDSRGWLVELFRQDELSIEFHPVMSYVSSTDPGITRGPHEHRYQADYFCFFGPSTFRLFLWDNRPGSPSYGQKCHFDFGEGSMASVLVPPGVVHAYKNMGSTSGLVYNAPNKLYAGAGRTEPIDEIRHENDATSKFKIPSSNEL